LEAFSAAVQHYTPTRTKEFTLIVVTAPQRRILLGLKHRGFGTGMYNSFGGKLESSDETVEAGACRELQEETNIDISVHEMTQSKVGIQRFTFEHDPVEMIVHVFRIHLPKTGADDAPHDIRGCDEITPEWMEDWHGIPLDNMFADDSLWLTTLLESPLDEPVEINGSYHLRQETNTVLHYCMEVILIESKQPERKFSLEQRLFHAIHDNDVRSPSVKEFKECFAFLNAVRSGLGKQKRTQPIQFDVVIDVAGGHGALAALFLVCTSATKAVVVDPAQVGQGGVARAWKDFYGDKTLLYRPECLRTGLPAELKAALAMTTADRILVVACHACQHLSEETLEIACRFGVHAAVMPCCQKDLSPGSTWKSTSKRLGLPIATVMDILVAGKMMAAGSHDIRMKSIDSKITPQNRIIVCRALQEPLKNKNEDVEKAHAKLETAYRAAHGGASRKKKRNLPSEFVTPPIAYLAIGFAAGMFTALSFARR
jgi:8-oxo-dGTP pyrophosphatase MutT (NUDIX family)